MKRWLIALTAIAVVSLACVPLALAASHGKPQAKPHVKFQCEATIVSVDTSGLTATPATPATLTVVVKSGTKTIKVFRHLSTGIVVQIAPTAKLIDATVDPAVPLDLSTLALGDKVHIGGTIDRSTTIWTFTAKRVILQKKAPVTP